MSIILPYDASLETATGAFDFYESDILFRDSRDRDAEEEILELKKQTPLEDRHFFLK